jgi:RHS repeat-associated protein
MVILVLVLLIDGGTLNANTPGYCQSMPPGAKNFFLASPVERTPGDLRNNHTFECYKITIAYSVTVDKKGNTTQRGTQQLAYDYRNQLVTAVDAPSSTQVEMRYDVLGRRTQKSVTIGGQTKIENYYHSGHQVIEVRDGNDQVLRQYIYGNGIDEVIRMDKFEGDTVTAYYYHTDASGSVTAITDANGQLVERVSYDIYGMPTFWDASGNKIPKSSIGNNILFHGREYDEELNLYYFRARYYCPIMGRFLQTDPMGYHDAMNLYQAFGMNPINFTDPFGDAVMPGVDPAVVMSAYIQFIQSGDSPDTALRKLEEYGYIDSEDSYKLALVASAHAEPGAQILGTTAYIMFEFSPAGVFKDAVSLPFGKDLVSGEKLKWWQKALIATPFVAKAVSKGSKLIKVLSEGVEEGSDLAKGGVKVLSKDEMADIVAAGDDLKKVPNPYGKKGGPLHQGKIKEIAQELRKKGYKVKFEDHIPTPGGFKDSRYVDIIVHDPITKEKWVIQVGIQTKKGLPISREIKAIRDLEEAGYIVEFVPYN